MRMFPIPTPTLSIHMAIRTPTRANNLYPTRICVLGVYVHYLAD